jgi:hypothetical protein
VLHALIFEQHLMRLLEVSLDLASWRLVLHCNRRNTPSPLRLACCARGRVVMYRSRERPPNPPFTAALGLIASFSCVVRVSVLCGS